MDVKEAARMAKDYLANVFSEEEITHIGLQEVDFDEVSKTWKVTVGFFRPWERPGLTQPGRSSKMYTRGGHETLH